MKGGITPIGPLPLPCGSGCNRGIGFKFILDIIRIKLYFSIKNKIMKYLTKEYIRSKGWIFKGKGHRKIDHFFRLPGERLPGRAFTRNERIYMHIQIDGANTHALIFGTPDHFTPEDFYRMEGDKTTANFFCGELPSEEVFDLIMDITGLKKYLK